MANNLPFEKKVAVVSMLAEGSSIRAIERITGVNQNTIMSLGLRVGTASKKIMDEKMRGLSCKQIQVDEIWGFVGAKQKNAKRAGAYGEPEEFITILELPPVDSPQSAVKVGVAYQIKKARQNGGGQ
jgi:hypothetical protein